VLSLEAGALAAPHSGVLARIDEERLLELATRADCVLTVPTPLGAYVPAGAPLVLVDGKPLADDAAAPVLDVLRAGALSHDEAAARWDAWQGW
jgi:uncharacterized membrane protein